MDTASSLSCLYAGCTTGYLSVWDLQTSLTAYFDITKDIPAAVAYAREKANTRHDVYFGVGLRDEPRAPSERGKKIHVSLLTCLWLDIDIKGPGHKRDDLPENIDQAVELLDVCPLSPSIIVDTGGGIHCYWLFNQPISLVGDTARYNAASKNFQKQFIIAAAAKKLHVDQTGNVDRVLRLPDTWNYKAEPRRPVKAIFHEDHRYDVLDLISVSQTVQVQVARESGLDFLATAKQRLPNLANQENRDLMQKVLKGEPFAESGERDSTLQKAASCLAFVLSPKEAKLASAEALALLFEASIAAMAALENDPDNPALTMEAVRDKISRALDDRARQVTQDEELLSVFGQTVQTTALTEIRLTTTEEPPPSSSETQPPSETTSKGEEELFYTAEQVIEYAKENKCKPSQFVKRWIIQHASSYYVFSKGKYQCPVGRESLLTHLREDLKPAGKVGVTLEVLTQGGGVRAKSLPEVLKDYATGARVLKGSLWLQESKFDAEHDAFWEAVCPVRDIEPVFDEKIDKWLRLLGGDEEEKLLDWVATVLRLDLQSSALYLNGVAGSGKTMLAHGLARLWSTSGPSLLENIADTAFNADIARCPLVLGDEAVKCSTSELRRLVGSSSHVLKRKYLANVDLEGAIRIILADNSGKLIHGSELGGEDLDAVASKFLHVTVAKPPFEYLRDLGGRRATDGWVDGNKIAAHAMWLGLNRKIVLGNRLAVEGRISRMTQLLVVGDRVTGVLCEWIALYLVDSTEAIRNMLEKTIKPVIVIGNGKILISAEAVSKNWEAHIKHESKAFSLTKIGSALSNISETGRVQRGGRRYHSVKPDLIYAWAEKNLSCDIEDLKKKVDSIDLAAVA